MIFGGGKKALSSELQSKIEEILLLVEKMEPDAGRSSDNPMQVLPSLVSTLRDATQIMSQRVSELVSSHGRLASEYEEFVKSCEATNDLSQGKRYQLASDFFSYVVAHGAKHKKAIEALAQDFTVLSEELGELAKKVQDTSASAPGASQLTTLKETTEKLKESVKGLAERLSIELKPPAEEEPEQSG